MDHKKAQEIALKRYGSIAPLVSENIDAYKSKSDFFRDAGSKAGVHPHTVRRWYDRYLEFGFDGLIPKQEMIVINIASWMGMFKIKLFIYCQNIQNFQLR